MDAKTMIYFLKPDGLMKDGNRVVLLADEIANEISDYIEQQEKYAELGRLALTTRAMVCSNNDFIKRGVNKCEEHCTNNLYCKKRAELLVGESNDNTNS